MPDIAGWFTRGSPQAAERKAQKSAQQVAGAQHQADVGPTPQVIQAAIRYVYQAAQDAVEVAKVAFEVAQREQGRVQATAPLLPPLATKVWQAFQSAQAAMGQSPKPPRPPRTRA